jgi:hypothetical protein
MLIELPEAMSADVECVYPTSYIGHSLEERRLAGAGQ